MATRNHKQRVSRNSMPVGAGDKNFATGVHDQTDSQRQFLGEHERKQQSRELPSGEKDVLNDALELAASAGVDGCSVQGGLGRAFDTGRAFDDSDTANVPSVDAPFPRKRTRRHQQSSIDRCMSRDCNLPYEKRSALTCFAFISSPSHLCWYWPQCSSPVAAKDQRLKRHSSASFAIRKSSSRAMAPRTGAPLPSCLSPVTSPSAKNIRAQSLDSHVFLSFFRLHAHAPPPSPSLRGCRGLTLSWNVSSTCRHQHKKIVISNMFM